MNPISTFLDGRTPTHLRGLAFLALSESGNVLRLAGTADNAGGGAHQSWGTAGSAIPCRVSPIGAERGLVADQVNESSTHVIRLPPATNVVEADRFQIGSRLFEITAVRTRTREPLRELEAVEI